MRIFVLIAAIAATVLGVLPASAQIGVQEERLETQRERRVRDYDRVVRPRRYDNPERRVRNSDCVVRVGPRRPNGKGIVETRPEC
jgi:hypothetical protein